MEISRLVFSPIEVNTYILSDNSGRCAIIDCGCYNNVEATRLARFLESAKLKPVLLLNTHCHLDHIFGNRFILEKYGLKSHFHRLEEANRIDAPRHAMLFGLKMQESPEAESYIDHGQNTGFDDIRLLSLHVPGHTAGSIAFYSATDACVFTGDALFEGSIGRSDLPGGDHQTLIDSIRKNLLTLPPETVVYPGHGQATTIGREKNSNPYLL